MNKISPEEKTRFGHSAAVLTFAYLCKCWHLRTTTIFIFIIGMCVFCFYNCTETNVVPKPRAYPKVVYPEKQYKPFDAGYCNFTFDQAVYAVAEQDTTYFDERAKSDCWFNLVVKSLNAKIFCSYYPVKNRADFDELVRDAFEMTNKHNVKANYIEEMPVHRPKDNVHGVVFNVEGPAASSYQFFLTDSVHHFVRGALYFNTEARPDSLAPVVKFMKEDLNRLVETLVWKQN